MKRTIRASARSVAQAIDASGPASVLTRFKLAFLDEYSCEKRGYDPYDTARHRSTPDIWTSKHKRA
jgi:hypothetical protein